jgi:hypothetical protein
MRDMNFKKYLPSIVAGFGAAVLSTIPGIKSLSCCLLVPGAAYLSLYLYNKSTGDNSPIQLNKALSYGLITGLVAALFTTLFDLLITYLTHSNDLVAGLPQTEEVMNNFNLGPLMDESIKLIKQMATDIKQTGFSALYAVMITVSNFFILSIFGMLGGLLGMAVLNKSNRPKA